MLGEIRRLTKFASQFEDEFVKAVIGHSQQAEATDRKPVSYTHLSHVSKYKLGMRFSIPTIPPESKK